MNPLTLSIIGLYKTAVIRRRGSWRTHASLQRCAHLLVEHEQMLDALALGGKVSSAIEPVHGPVKRLVRAGGASGATTSCRRSARVSKSRTDSRPSIPKPAPLPDHSVTHFGHILSRCRWSAK